MAGGTRPGSGRKQRQIDLVELEKLCTLQCTDEEIAAFFEVNVRTIARRKKRSDFAEAMESGKAKGRLSVRRHLFRLAAAGNIAAVIFLAKNILGYRDVVANEHSGPNGAPIPIAASPNFSQLSNEELEQLRSIAQKTRPHHRD